jgi:hypothetical protein
MKAAAICTTVQLCCGGSTLCEALLKCNQAGSSALLHDAAPAAYLQPTHAQDKFVPDDLHAGACLGLSRYTCSYMLLRMFGSHLTIILTRCCSNTQVLGVQQQCHLM